MHPIRFVYFKHFRHLLFLIFVFCFYCLNLWCYLFKDDLGAGPLPREGKEDGLNYDSKDDDREPHTTTWENVYQEDEGVIEWCVNKRRRKRPKCFHCAILLHDCHLSKRGVGCFCNIVLYVFVVDFFAFDTNCGLYVTSGYMCVLVPHFAAPSFDLIPLGRFGEFFCRNNTKHSSWQATLVFKGDVRHVSPEYLSFFHYQAASRVRPFLRRFLSTFLPVRVWLRLRNPCVFARFFFLG